MINTLKCVTGLNKIDLKYSLIKKEGHLGPSNYTTVSRDQKLYFRPSLAP
jgi:hypothetical protein